MKDTKKYTWRSSKNRDVRPEDIYCVCDAASGITQNSLPVLRLGNAILIFFRWSQQHIQGTEVSAVGVRRWLINNVNALRTRLYKIGSCGPSEEQRVRLKDMYPKDRIVQSIFSRKEFVENELKGDIDFTYIANSIPEHDALKFFERIVAFTNLEAHESYREVVSAYEEIADQLIRDRKKIILE